MLTLSFVVECSLPWHARAQSAQDWGLGLLEGSPVDDDPMDGEAGLEDPAGIYNDEGEPLTDDGAFPLSEEDVANADPAWGLDLLDGLPTAEEDAGVTPDPAATCASSRLRRGFNVVAEADVDECFAGVGREPGTPNNNGRCPRGSSPKKNQTYAWGMTEEGRHLWWGTGANAACQLLAPAPGQPTLPPLDGQRLVGFMCELGSSWKAQEEPWLGNLGDWRQPQIWRMDTCTLERRNMTPTTDRNINDVIGFRSAGSIDDVVFFAGPAGAATGNFSATTNGDGVIVMAFEESTGRYLGSQKFDEYRNVRQWLVYRGQLYVGMTRKANRGGGGDILKWTGGKIFPFRFTTVGRIDTAPANMTVHEGRIYTTTWPDTDANGVPLRMAGVWMSPRIPIGGLTTINQGGWRRIWQVDQYEPDPAIAMSYGLGPIRSWRGALYWGTMHFPLGGLIGHHNAYGRTWRGSVGLASTVLTTQRSATLFRGEDFGGLLNPSEGRVRVLYGDPVVPVYNGSRFVLRQTRGGLPRFGLGGFNYWLNSYVWQMGITNGNLFMATYDLSDSLAGAMQAAGNLNGGIIPRFLTAMIAVAGANPVIAGADMWRFRLPILPATPVTINGGGNPTQFGFRTMVSKDDFLWVGTAGARPLAEDGGYKILRFQPIRTIINVPEDGLLVRWVRWIWSLPLRIIR
jgi:hypothetical protein